jgi:RNA-binding protein YlmH
LILGRFTDERKAVLDALRDELRNRNLLPILFDFAIPASRDVTETIKTLAGLARFVIADVTDATEVRAELQNIVPDFTSLPIQLILLRGHPEFVSLSHLKKFQWVLPIFEYDDQQHLLASLDKSVISPAENAARELRS